MNGKVEFLRSLALFNDMDDDQLEVLAEIAPEYEFHKGSVIAYQRDVANSLYIVRSGRLFASRVDEQGRVRETRAYEPGQYFQDVWLFEPEAHPATVRATDAGRLIIIDGPEFARFLDLNPDVVERLEPLYNENDEWIGGLSEEAWEELVKSRLGEGATEYRAAALLVDELVEYWNRRSRWLLWLEIGTTVAALVAWVAGYGYLAINGPFLRTPLSLVLFFAIPVLALLLLIFYEYVDWRNDYLMVTNKQVLHYEFSLNPRRFGTTVQKIPIDQIQSVTVIKPNLLSNILNLGSVRITSASAVAGITFNYLSNPHEVREAINRVQGRVRALQAGHEQALMRRTLERHFNVAAPYERVQEEQDGLPEERPSLFYRIRARFATRLEEGGVVTYRRSIIFLLLRLRWALLLGTALFAGMLYLMGNDASAPFWIIWGVLVIINTGYFIWLVEDWRNDQFQVSDRYVVDIDRLPFGFGESRKQAELSNIQNVNAIRPGLLANIFNYGNVEIETAGATADIVFDRVAFPNLVQQDIFSRREKLRRRQQEAASARRREEYALLLDVYQQIQEQEMVPRRTAPIEYSEERENGRTGDNSTG